MELPFSKSLRRSVRRRGYTRVTVEGESEGSQGQKTKMVKLGGNAKRIWKIKVAPKLKLKGSLLAPLKLWSKIKNGYFNMMVNYFASDGKNIFGEKRIPGARQAQITYAPSEFENRLILEIYKSLVASRESGNCRRRW